MTPLVLDIDIINPAIHQKAFTYIGDFGPGRPNKLFLEFNHIAEWRDYLLSLQIRSETVPTIHADAYHAALHMMLLAWAEPAVIKSAELQALCGLESALMGVYFQQLFEREQAKHKKVRDNCDGCKKCQKCATLDRDNYRPGLDNLLDYMVKHDDLPSALHNESKKKNFSALSVIRNKLGHCDIHNTLPVGGLFESVRDVLEHACRNSKTQRL
ncbi:MAG: hypothetical protein ACYCQL_03740 [Acidithiobacillus sp.]|jgi:hypothetical protein